MSNTNDGGPAFPCDLDAWSRGLGGMSMRDYFAANLQVDDRLVKCVRAMDDNALEIFALHPDLERDDRLADIDLTCWSALPSEIAKITRRLELEAVAIARVRFMQADAMLAAREAKP